MDQAVTVIDVNDANAPIPALPAGDVPVQYTEPPVHDMAPVQVIDALPQAQEVLQPVQSGTLPLIAGYLNIGIGLVVLAVLGMYLAGFGIWVTHLHVSGRSEGIHWMQNAVITLFWLIVVLALIRFVQYHTATALVILSFAIVGLLVWFAIQIAKSGGDEDEH